MYLKYALGCIYGSDVMELRVWIDGSFVKEQGVDGFTFVRCSELSGSFETFI